VSRTLLTGSSGFIGSRVAAALAAVGHAPVLASRTGAQPALGAQSVPLDLADLDSVERAVVAAKPDAVIHCAALRDLAACDQNPALAHAVNFLATERLAHTCRALRVTLVFVSTDQVFDGVSGNYAESHPTNPINTYGETKARAEEAVLACGGRVARVALTLGHSREGTRSPNEHVVNALRSGQPCTLFTNEFRTPIHVDDVATALVEMLAPGFSAQVLHLGGPDRVNRMTLGLDIARAYRLPTNFCTPATSTGLRRAPDTSLDTTLAQRLLKNPPRRLAAAIYTLVQTHANDR
jgi:dTDP-4-dehydrorhamnose reductase